MSEAQLILPDDQEIKVETGTPVLSLFEYFPKRQQKEAIAVRFDDEVFDLSASCKEGRYQFDLVSVYSDEGREILNHSGTHILAEAVTSLFPGSRHIHGPATKDGFFYDFVIERDFTGEDLEKINEKVQEIVAENRKFQRYLIKREEAIERYREEDNVLKVEMLEGIEDSEVSFYSQGEFNDLCRGPHLPQSSIIKAIKIMNAGAVFWKGDRNREVLQRVYGIAFPDRKMLRKHLNFLQEAKKRDHRRLGSTFDLFSTAEEYGPGFALFHPKGAILLDLIERWWRDVHVSHGYELVRTPHIFKSDIWKITGHYEHYKENMFITTIDNEEYAVKPMNCPGHAIIYKKRTYSYKDLPVRFAEWGTVYRNEISGTLHGLTRVRGITQDDAHIYLSSDMIEAEVKRIIDLTVIMYSHFEFEDWVYSVATRPESSIGAEELWDTATSALINALEERKLNYEIEEGGGAFYGPKIDVQLKDAIGRYWQCGTIQIDFNLGPRFDLTYVNEHGEKVHPVVIHRTILGAMERFMGIYLEHTAGVFPFWLSPVQFIIIPITDRNLDYCESLSVQLIKLGFRAKVDKSDERMNYKIRAAQKLKIPYMLIIGDSEAEQSNVSVRKRDNTQVNNIPLESLLKEIVEETK